MSDELSVADLPDDLGILRAEFERLRAELQVLRRADRGRPARYRDTERDIRLLGTPYTVEMLRMWSGDWNARLDEHTGNAVFEPVVADLPVGPGFHDGSRTWWDRQGYRPLSAIPVDANGEYVVPQHVKSRLLESKRRDMEQVRERIEIWRRRQKADEKDALIADTLAKTAQTMERLASGMEPRNAYRPGSSGPQTEGFEGMDGADNGQTAVPPAARRIPAKNPGTPRRRGRPRTRKAGQDQASADRNRPEDQAADTVDSGIYAPTEVVDDGDEVVRDI